MASYTLTYSQSAKGWPSFYSYKPEMMVGMNNYFYSFKNGNLYRHNTNATRNNFYGTQYNSTLTGVINDAPNTVKTFKTISLEGNNPWDCTITTDLGSGFIDSNWFVKKEGEHYAHIRRTADDDVFELRSALGIGQITSLDSSTASAVVLTFGFNIGSTVSVGDKLYKESGGNVSLVGNITAISGVTITVDTTVTGGSIPSASQFVMHVKNNIAESYGTTGYYLQYVLENNSTTFTELYSVGSKLFKSFP